MQSAESPSGRDSSHNRRIKKYENDDISQEQVVRIYHEELVKLMGRRLEDQPFHGYVCLTKFLLKSCSEDLT